jgi:flagellar biogenesis protein FliO
MRGCWVALLLIFTLVAQTAQAQAPQAPESKLQRARRILSENSQPASTQQAASENISTSSAASSLWQMLQGLGICVGTFLVGVHFWKRSRKTLGAVPSARRLRVVERLGLGSKHAIALVEVDGRSVLVGMGAGTIALADMEAAASLRILKDFQELQESETHTVSPEQTAPRTTILRTAVG